MITNGVSFPELAEWVNISKHTLYNYGQASESGSAPSYNKAMQIIEVLAKKFPNSPPIVNDLFPEHTIRNRKETL